MVLSLGLCDRSPRARRADERRERIIAAARQLFGAHGFHNTGIAQIARESGVLVGQIYRDFASKEDIVAAIVELDLQQFLADQDLCCAIGRGDIAAVREWIHHFVVGDDVDDYRLVAEIMAEASRNDRMACIFRSVEERLRCGITQAVALLAPPHACAERRYALVELILTLSSGVFHRRLGHQGGIDPHVARAIAATVERELIAITA